LKSPFDERKYKRLLEGLEVSEILVSDFFGDNSDFRLDAEYFSKKNIELNQKLEKTGYKRIDEIAFVTDGIHTSIDYSEESKIKLVSATSPRENYFDFSRNVFISEKVHLQNPRTALKIGDIIISTVGTIGNCAVVKSSDLPANSDRHVGIIRINNKQFLSNYVSTFLLSKYGRFQTIRESTGNVQLNLFIYKIKTLKIANLSMNFQNKIECIVNSAHSNREKSQSLYRQAEELLLKTIGLLNFKPSKKATNIKSFKKSFLTTGRLDAEYYQPIYERVEKIIKKNGFVCLENICSTINYRSVPTSPYTEEGNGIPYIKGLNLKSTFIIKDKLDYIVNTKGLPSKVFTKEGDIVISQMGTVGDIGVVTKDEAGWIFASFTIRARLKKNSGFLPRFIGLYIQNIAKNYYLQQNIAQASVRQNTDLPTIRKMYIPKVEIIIQQQIADLIDESFSLRRKSEKLLEEAKTMVEREIEG
jgi:restriction endonuclease S subunit